jgi:hypothetical protein
MLGQYQPLSTYHLPSAPILTVPIPNLPVSVAEKALRSLSSPPPFGGNERCILSFFSILSILTIFNDLRVLDEIPLVLINIERGRGRESEREREGDPKSLSLENFCVKTSSTNVLLFV